MNITPVSGALGAEVRDIDLRSANETEWETIRAAFLEHLVLFFPGQDLDGPSLQTVGARFGELEFYPFIESLTEAPYVIPIVKEADERKNFGEGWHSDTTYTERPPKATMLYAVEVPERGGDTLFANMYLAYETLSETMQHMLAPLRAINSTAKRTGGGRSTGNQFQSVTFKNRDRELEGIHPVVRRHPETGRDALYINALHTARFEGFTDEESEPILAYLHQHKARPEFTCRHQWDAGTLAVWDNRAAQHYALNDYHGHRREMLRLSIAGEIPQGA